MTSRGARTSWALALVAVGAACWSVAAGAAPDPSPRGATCGPHADSMPGEATSKQFRKAVGCLINAKRAKRGRVKLDRNRALTRIAKRHSKVMVREKCLQHQCPGERPLRRRIEASKYLEKGGRYGYGENLGCSTTPRGMVSTWMLDSFHRKNIIDRRFRDFGIGAKRGSPFPRGSRDCSPGRNYMTYTVVFGWRQRGG